MTTLFDRNTTASPKSTTNAGGRTLTPLWNGNFATAEKLHTPRRPICSRAAKPTSCRLSGVHLRHLHGVDVIEHRIKFRFEKVANEEVGDAPPVMRKTTYELAEIEPVVVFAH